VIPGVVLKGPAFSDLESKIETEGRNAIRQFDFVLQQIEDWTTDCRVDARLICKLQEIAIAPNYRCAGHFRDGEVTLQGSTHQPPPYQEVPKLVEEMCEYVAAQWHGPALPLAAYLLWRLNWIHPFFGGNGRTSRALTYLVLCVRLGLRLPGKITIPQLIAENPGEYYSALRSADRAFAAGTLDVSELEAFLAEMLTRQLRAVQGAAQSL
jgi:Fic family protein